MLDNLKQCTSSCVVTKSVGGHNSPSHKLNSHGSNVFLPCLWQTGHQVIQTGRPGVRPQIVKLPTIHNWIYAPPPLIALGIWCREPYWYRTLGGWCQSGTRWMMSFRHQMDDVSPTTFTLPLPRFVWLPPPGCPDQLSFQPHPAAYWTYALCGRQLCWPNTLPAPHIFVWCHRNNANVLKMFTCTIIRNKNVKKKKPWWLQNCIFVILMSTEDLHTQSHN